MDDDGQSTRSDLRQLDRLVEPLQEQDRMPVAGIAEGDRVVEGQHGKGIRIPRSARAARNRPCP
jgi:hypothetical protein